MSAADARYLTSTGSSTGVWAGSSAASCLLMQLPSSSTVFLPPFALRYWSYAVPTARQPHRLAASPGSRLAYCNHTGGASQPENGVHDGAGLLGPTCDQGGFG